MKIRYEYSYGAGYDGLKAWAKSFFKPNGIISYFYKAMGNQTCFISAYNLNSQGVVTDLLYPINTQNMTNGSKTFTFTYSSTGRQYLSFAFYFTNHTNPLATRFFTIDNFTVKFTGNYPFTETVALYDGKDYRYGFNGLEKDNEVKGRGKSYDFGARIYDSRLGRWMSVDPSQVKYPNLSPYNSFENNPVFFNEPDGRDAIGKIEGNTITISATIYVANDKSLKINITEAQKIINNYWGKDFKYIDENGKQYNVKFEITVKEISPIKGSNPVDEGSNFVRPMPESYRSKVRDKWYGRWAINKNDRTYAHEVGHMLGLADQYAEVEYNSGNLDINVNNGERESWDYENTAPDELMGTARGVKPGQEKVTQRDINAIAGFVLKNQKNGKTVINIRALFKVGLVEGLAAPSQDEKNIMQLKADENYRDVVEPHSNDDKK